jgi:hypothetical protein
MSKAVKVLFLLVLLSSAVCAEDVATEFTFQTLDGKTINSQAYRGKPMVINIGSHW